MLTNLKDASFWKKPQRSYPNASSCIGTQVGTYHGRIWWHARGSAREKFLSIEQDVIDQLQAVCTESYTSILHFCLYMIGSSEVTAVPTIMFFCEQKEPRKKAKQAIEDGNILERLPGFRVGHQAKQPGVGTLIQPATGKAKANTHAQPVTTDVYFDPSHPILAFGMPIFIKHGEDTIRQATANVVSLNGTLSFLSVSHVLFGDGGTVPESTAMDSDSDYDFGSGAESEPEDACVIATSRGSVSSQELSSSDMPDETLSASRSSALRSELSDPQTQALLDVGRPVDQFTSHTQIMDNDHNTTANFPSLEDCEYLGSLIEFRVDLDCALVSIANPVVYATVYATVESSQQSRLLEAALKATLNRQSESSDCTPIIATTSQGPITGFLSEDMVHFRLPKSTTFQRVYSVTLDDPLCMGDCGSLIIDAITGDPCGYVVASSTDRQVAFAINTSEALESLGLQMTRPFVVNTTVVGEVTTAADETIPLSRSRATSSVGSEQYTQLPPGRWLLDFHGSCPRCHHYHGAVKVKINTSSEGASHIHCENCSSKWLAFGGRNSTRISLLSTMTTEPDPVEQEVRSTLMSMVRSSSLMAAVGSPRLAEIAESSRSVQGPQSMGHNKASMSTNSSSVSDLSVSSIEMKKDSNEQGSMLIGANVRERLRRLRNGLRKRLNLGTRDSQTPEPVPEGSRTKKATVDEFVRNTEHSPPPPQLPQPSTINKISKGLSGKASEYISTLKDEPIEIMNEDERIAWMRYRMSKLKKARAEAEIKSDLPQSAQTRLNLEGILGLHHRRMRNSGIQN